MNDEQKDLSRAHVSRPVSHRLDDLLPAMIRIHSIFAQTDEVSARKDDRNLADFIGGNPQEWPLGEVVAAIQKCAIPQRRNWFAYCPADAAAAAIIAESLQSRHAIPYQKDDIILTNGSFGALALALRTVVDPGDEVVLCTPGWHFYESLIVFAGAKPVRVPLRAPDFDLDVDAIGNAITADTRAVLINTPNNPTGRIYPPEALRQLGSTLRQASHRTRNPIYLLSDESYSRILFDGRSFESPTNYYSRAFLIYTYAKTLLTPGLRIGYLALPPDMPDKQLVRTALAMVQTASGYAYPDVILQYAIGDFERTSIDVAHLQRKRDRLVASLRQIGYLVDPPEATFWLLVRSPMRDDEAFAKLLSSRSVFVVPGSAIELNGYIRLSLTASDEMIERALPVFKWAFQRAVSSEHDEANTYQKTTEGS